MNDGAKVMVAARKAVEADMRKRYRAKGPLMEAELAPLITATRRRCADPDGAHVEDAVKSVLLEGKVLGRYVLTEDWRSWVTPEHGWDLVRDAGLDLVDLTENWRSAPGRTHGSMRPDIIRSHVRKIAAHVKETAPEDALLVLPALLRTVTYASKVEMYKAMKVLEPAPVEALTLLLQDERDRRRSWANAEEVANTIAAILSPAGQTV